MISVGQDPTERQTQTTDEELRYCNKDLDSDVYRDFVAVLLDHLTPLIKTSTSFLQNTFMGPSIGFPSSEACTYHSCPCNIRCTTRGAPSQKNEVMDVSKYAPKDRATNAGINNHSLRIIMTILPG